MGAGDEREPGIITTGGDKPGVNLELLDACIHCGLCLPACPTYLATGREMESPRGRIYLLDLWSREKCDLTSDLARHIDSCLGCLGCQTACPSGVRYEAILNQARPHLAGLREWRSRHLMRYVFARILPDYRKLRAMGNALRLWQSAGGQRLVAAMPWLKGALGRLAQWQAFLPDVPRFQALPRQSWISGEKRGPVQLFSGCVMDVLYNQVNHACLRLLTLQRRVVGVPEQTCCGALAYHAGEVDIACDLARRNIELFEGTQGEIVVTAAGCGAMLKHYGELMKGDREWRERAREFSARVRDITECLDAGEFARTPRPLPLKVAYHAACHLHHAQKVTEAPGRLLEALPGVTVLPLREAEHCCGSAGIFNLTHTELSLQVLDRKTGCVADCGADVLVTTNPGCQLQLEKGMKAAGLPVRVCHLAELLDEAYGGD